MAKVKSLWEDKYNAVANSYFLALANGVDKEIAIGQAEAELRKLGFFGNRLKDELDILGED